MWVREACVASAICSSGIFDVRVGAHQAVGLLECVGKLRVAKARKQRDVDHDLHDLGIHAAKFGSVVGDGVAPGARCSERFGREGDTAEFGQYDRLAAVRVAVKREDAAVRTPPVEQLLGLDLDSLTQPQVLAVDVVVVDADDVDGAASPAVVADHRARRVQRLGQVEKRLHRVALLPTTFRSGTP